MLYYADMAELADALDLESSPRGCRFDSCYPHISLKPLIIQGFYYYNIFFALYKISLHNSYFPKTRLQVIGFGRDLNDEFKIIVEQPFVEGTQLTEGEIIEFVTNLGFELRNLKNWTYTTPEIYLSDMHDENLIKSPKGNIFVIDCDIRINTPELRLDGVRKYTTEIISTM